MALQRKLRIGVDFGKVMAQDDGAAEGKEAVQKMNTQIDMPGCLDVLNEYCKSTDFYLISHAGKKRALATIQSIKDTCPHVFASLHFTKSGVDKAVVIGYLDCDAMIDDRPEILEAIKTLYPHVQCYLFAGANADWKKVGAWIASLSIGARGIAFVKPTVVQFARAQYCLE